jgi:hypothetical protein
MAGRGVQMAIEHAVPGEAITPDDTMLRLVDRPGNQVIAAVHADGRVEVDWPAIETLGARAYVPESCLATAVARLLLWAREEGRAK